MGFDEGMAGFVLPSTQMESGVSQRGKGHCKTGENSLPGRSSVMDTGDKELHTSFILELWQKKVNIIHDLRRESNLGFAFDLTFIKSNDKAALRMLYKTRPNILNCCQKLEWRQTGVAKMILS